MFGNVDLSPRTVDPVKRKWIGTRGAYFEREMDGQTAVCAETEIRDDRGPRRILHRVYKDAYGYLVPMPLNDGERMRGAAPSAVGRVENTDLGARDLYLAKKGWAWAVPADVLAWEKVHAESQKTEADRKRAANPVTAQERIAELNAKATAGAVREAVAGALREQRGGK